MEIKQHNLLLISFNKFICNIEDIILQDIEKYNLSDKPITNKDVKKIFYHHLIKSTIEEFVKVEDTKLVMIFTSNEMPTCKLSQIYGSDSMLKFLERFISKIENMLPVRILLCESILPQNLLVNACKTKIMQQTKKSFTFQKIKLFAKRYELTYLNDDFLNRIKTKQVLIQ